MQLSMPRSRARLNLQKRSSPSPHASPQMLDPCISRPPYIQVFFFCSVCNHTTRRTRDKNTYGHLKCHQCSNPADIDGENLVRAESNTNCATGCRETQIYARRVCWACGTGRRIGLGDLVCQICGMPRDGSCVIEWVRHEYVVNENMDGRKEWQRCSVEFVDEPVPAPGGRRVEGTKIWKVGVGWFDPSDIS